MHYQFMTVAAAALLGMTTCVLADRSDMDASKQSTIDLRSSDRPQAGDGAGSERGPVSNLVFEQETILDDNGVGPGGLLAIGSSCPFANSAAEDFTLPAATNIVRVDWRGTYFGAAADFPGMDNNFHITFYEDDGSGNVGNVVADFPSVAVNKVQHPRPPIFGTNPVYSYSAVLPSVVAVTGGARYWISINGDPGGASGPVFGWMVSDMGNASSIAGNDQPLQTGSITCATLPALTYTPGGIDGDQDADLALLLYSDANDCNTNGIPDDQELAGDAVFAQETILDDSGIGPGALLAIGSSCPFSNTSAEDFTLAENAEIIRIGWRGTYFGTANDFPGMDNNFHITFYEDNGSGNVGSVIADFPSVSVAKALHPRPPVLGTNPVYSYEASLPIPVNVSGGQRYWVSINGDPDGNNGPVFGWMASDMGNAAAIAGNDQPLQTGSITCATLPALTYTPGGIDGDQDADLALFLYTTAQTNDCNNNGILDECDIDDGTSEDCNMNLVPDECDTAPEFPQVSNPAECDEGLFLLVPNSVFGNTDNMLPVDIYECGLNYSVFGVWGRYRPAWSGTAFFGFTSMSTPFTVTVFDDCPSNGGMQIACNTPNPNGVTFEVERGRTYYIRWAAHGFNTGSFSGQIIGPESLESSNDFNDNGVPDECDCLFDVNGDGVVDASDFLEAQSNLGPCPGALCPSDVDGDGVVDFEDLSLILNNLGPCPFPVRASVSEGPAAK